MHSFSWRMRSFLGWKALSLSFLGGCTVFCCGTALTYKLCILLLLDYFQPRNDGFVSCLPFTEHVQTLFTLNWACANSVLGMCRNNLHNLPCFWQFWLITMTETEHEHRLRLIDLTTSAQLVQVVRRNYRKSPMFRRYLFFWVNSAN